MVDKYYKAYYMMTARCNLSCSYCVLENAPYQLAMELPLVEKMALIKHLYSSFNVRSLTISGGEPLCIGNNNGRDFILLMEFIKDFNNSITNDKLVVKMYSNSLLLNEKIVAAMQGVIDCVSINIDSCDDTLLRAIGRSNNNNGSYFDRVLSSMQLLYKHGIRIKLHTVVSAINSSSIGSQVKSIIEKVAMANPQVEKWKFYQYMSYDDPVKDERHRITTELFHSVCKDISNALKGCKIKAQFKSIDEMNSSLFNILATGIAQYRRDNDTWTTIRRTKSLLEYNSINEMLADTDIDASLFDKYHSLAQFDN